MRIIRFSKEFDKYSGKEKLWLDPNYLKYNSFNNYYMSYLTDKHHVPDSAFGDRLLFWAQSVYMGYLLKFKCKLQFKLENYPEVYFFRFPYSKFLPSEEFYRGINQFSHLSLDDYLSIQNDGIVPNNLPELVFCNHVYDIQPNLNFYNLIQLKYPKMEDDLIELFGDYISVHVRRFSGIKYDEDDLLELPEEVREEYAEDSYFYNDSWTWKFIKDQEYFNQLDRYPGCKFYVSTDLPRRYYYSKWSERYPIITMHDVIDQFRSIMVKYYGEESVERNWNLIYRMIDYFGIMYSKEALCAKHYKAKSISLWSWSATKIGPTKRTVFEAGYL